MDDVRKGGWIYTNSGRQFYPLDPRPGDIDINDIAHSLANQCRFSGHCRKHYSVAQHSVLVSMLCDPQDALWGLLHDASEAYLIDVPSPLKKLPEFLFYREAEARLMAMVCDVFGLNRDEPPSVKIADRRMCVTEARDLMKTKTCQVDAEPYDTCVVAWSHQVARSAFLNRFNLLTRKGNVT